VYCLQACSWSDEECIVENEGKNNELQKKPLIILFFPFFLCHLKMYFPVKGSASIPATIKNPL